MARPRRTAGTGHIEERSPGTWLVQVSSGRRADGRPRRVSKTVHGTRRDAEVAAARLSAEMGARPNMGDGMTLDEYFYGVYAASHAKLLANATWERYKSVWKVHVSPALGDLPADEVSRAVVQAWVSGMTPGTADKAFRTLRSVMRCMWDDELLDEKPLERRVRLPQGQRRLADSWDDAEVLEAMRRLKGERIEPLWLVMVGGGLRREEALAVDASALLFDDVTLMDGTGAVLCRVTVDSARTQWDEGPKGTKTHQTRVVTIGEPFSSRLRLLAGLMGPGSLFRRLDGGDMSPGSVPLAWRRLFDEGGALHGMRFVQLRTMRHAHETMASRAGVSDSLNARVHGHSGLVAYEHYLARSQDDADSVAVALGDRLASES